MSETKNEEIKRLQQEIAFHQMRLQFLNLGDIREGISCAPRLDIGACTPLTNLDYPYQVPDNTSVAGGGR